MSRFKTWLISDRRFLNYFRATTRRLPNHCHSFLYSSSLSATRYSSYLSFFFQNKSKRVSAPSTPKVPPTGGTFSFQEQKNIWLFEIEKIPPRYREGLIKYLEKYRSRIFLFSVFSPHSYSYDLAEKSDYYFVKKRSWTPIIKQMSYVFSRALATRSVLPDFPRKFTLREKIIMRALWRFRHQFLSLEKVSSYIYGRRMPRNLHSTEAIISRLRNKLTCLTGKHTAIKRIRNYGYRMEEEIWKDLFEEEQQ